MVGRGAAWDPWARRVWGCAEASDTSLHQVVPHTQCTPQALARLRTWDVMNRQVASEKAKNPKGAGLAMSSAG